MEIPKYYRSEFETWIVKLYDFSFRLASLGKDHQLRHVIAKNISNKSKRILDMATGTGEVAEEIKRHHPSTEVIGIDLSKQMLSIAKTKAKKEGLNIKYLRKNIENTNLKQNSFDAVTISFAMHEVPHKNRLNIINEAYRLLKKGGKFIIMDFSKSESWFMRLFMNSHLNFLEPKYAKEILTESFSEELKRNKFNKVKHKIHFNGIVQLVTGVK